MQPRMTVLRRMSVPETEKWKRFLYHRWDEFLMSGIAALCFGLPDIMGAFYCGPKTGPSLNKASQERTQQRVFVPQMFRTVPWLLKRATFP